MKKAIIAAAVLALGLPLIGTSSAQAGSLFMRDVTVHVAVVGVETQAQLADMLRDQGFTDIVLSSVKPNPVNPRPDRDPAFTSHPEKTPVHDGWNGIASKGGMTVQIYVDDN